MSRILIVDVQPKLLKSLRQEFSEEGFDVLTAETADSALVLASTKNPDVPILDRIQPGRDGVEVQRELRLRELSTPVLLLSARDQVCDRIEGLEASANDYLVKPLDFGEPLVRFRALLRRRADAGRYVLCRSRPCSSTTCCKCRWAKFVPSLPRSRCDGKRQACHQGKSLATRIACNESSSTGWTTPSRTLRPASASERAFP